MKKLLFATSNADKIRELREMMEPCGYEVLGMAQAGVAVDVEETGETFAENALQKARAVHALTGSLVLADDSGLVVDAMGGEPGVHSARWMGHETSYDIKNAEILRRLEGLEGPARSARYICAIAAVLPDGRELVEEAAMEGCIAHTPAGTHGFGYDPIFFLPQFGRTSAELEPDEKNQISHRGKAMRAMRDRLERMNREAGL